MTHPLKSSCLCIRFLSQKMTECSIGFWFWGFIRGNRPKMSQKFTIFKMCPKFPESDIHMKQVSHSPILGIVGDKKWCPFLHIFCTPNHWKWALSGVKNWVFGKKSCSLNPMTPSSTYMVQLKPSWSWRPWTSSYPACQWFRIGSEHATARNLYFV